MRDTGRDKINEGWGAQKDQVNSKRSVRRFQFEFSEKLHFKWTLAVNFLKKACYNIFLFCVSRNFLRISRKFRTNFNFVFRDIFAKLSENFAKLIISRNFRENTKTKIFAATINCSHISKKNIFSFKARRGLQRQN